MRVDRLEPQVRAGEQLRQRAAQIVVTKTKAVHPRVYLQVIAKDRAVRCGRRLHGAGGGRRRDCRRQRELEQSVEVADAQRAEDQNWHADPCPPENDGFLDVSACEQIRARGFERERDPLGSMPVRVCLDDSDDSRGRRSFGQKLLNCFEVGLQRRQVNVRDSASDHAPGARLAKRVCSRRNASRTMPVGPLRCLATISSAVPASGLFGSRL
jgi:hypothetical protein